ncbi:MAG: hypothetical protein ACD_13C00073G0002 [uncultured bacterium]|uniref:Uncharacterized protein n=2 Tax=Katanobacteria TaxID=422282 RepID=A0A0G1EQC5_UNCKA|nr:MAG: hypothetical protein ACD_13C00073G0002 [uncultured bacterium]KKT11993.1 MAG: hypothetical protein UV89_C0007G0003 [candidate division WWE3 bacterium GW2011_GWB2_43_22]OGC64178.1 MAG: hypothetical protein A2274_00795 [candidate division WWE3 bacterium RIFOXYA12_FULL_43_11]OGC74080.1 MAG: hypothetical protein A2473_00375 [candidate division WWE3 bacterium RIFOXYC2_FULL_42_13]OGC74132.1 MAG: hypothetical protein A2337_02905 [candidate division WWE3 bacterium RIFOXYB2_FULL_43_9]HBY10222.1 
MITKIKAPVSVISVYDHKKRVFRPSAVIWEGRRYKIVKLGYHHAFRTGKTFFHVFSAASETVYFKLVLNTDNLSWEVEEISDGQAD